MITSIEIENFKGIGERIKLDINPMTLLFGPNSAGKSSIIQALHYAREVILHGNLDAHQTEIGGKYVDLGGFKNFVHGRTLDENRKIRIKLTADIPKDMELKPIHTRKDCHSPIPKNLLKLIEKKCLWFEHELHSCSVEFTVVWDMNDSGPHIEDYNGWINGTFIGRSSRRYEGGGQDNVDINIDHPIFPDCFWNYDEYKRELDINRFDYTPLPYYQFISNDIEMDGVRYPLEKMKEQHNDDYETRMTKRHFRYKYDAACEEILEKERERQRQFEKKFIQQQCKNAATLAGWKDRLKTIPQGYPSLDEHWDVEPFIDSPNIPHTHPNNSYIKDTSPEYLDNNHKQSIEEEEMCYNALAIYFSEFMSIPVRVFRHILSDFRYLGPLRESLDQVESIPKYADPSRWATGLGAWDRLKKANHSEMNNIAHWLGKEYGLGLGYSIEKAEFKKFNHELLEDIINQELKKHGHIDCGNIGSFFKNILEPLPSENHIFIIPENLNIKLKPKDVGVGISQVVPVIVAALLKSKLLAIEQPELHLHPKLQANLGDLFIESVTRNGNTLLLETHSEHLILRILRRIREKNEGELPKHLPDFSPDDLSVYYIEQTDTGTKATRLRVDETGEFIDEWPDGFFEERAKELF